MSKKIEVDDSEKSKTILDICEEIKNTIEKLAGQSPSDLKKETLSKICENIKYEIEKLENLWMDNLEKSKKSTKKRKPSGFAKPTVISDELCVFLGKPNGTEMARTEVTKYITQYIKENNLQSVENKIKIIPDKKLSKLFNFNKDEEVTFFNLQKYMQVHFNKI